jgi:hypothetical protein
MLRKGKEVVEPVLRRKEKEGAGTEALSLC